MATPRHKRSHYACFIPSMLRELWLYYNVTRNKLAVATFTPLRHISRRCYFLKSVYTHGCPCTRPALELGLGYGNKSGSGLGLGLGLVLRWAHGQPCNAFQWPVYSIALFSFRTDVPVQSVALLAIFRLSANELAKCANIWHYSGCCSHWRHCETNS